MTTSDYPQRDYQTHSYLNLITVTVTIALSLITDLHTCQVLNCRRSSLRLQLPPLPLSSLPAPPTRHPPPKTPITTSKMKQEVGGVKMWAGQGGEVIEEERKAGLRWKARQLKESLSAKFSLKLLQLSSYD